MKLLGIKDMDAILEQLIQMSHALGDEKKQLAMLGEGNTSANCDDGTFWVKSSGSQLATIDASGFSRVNLNAIIKLLGSPSLSDDQIAQGLLDAMVIQTQRKPSVETFIHALFIKEGGVNWVGHTHPVSVLSILCSKAGAEPFLRHLFPDEIVVCGDIPMIVPYVDPGLPLAQAVRQELKRYLNAHHHSPKMVLMENHGLIALGATHQEVINISLMADKWARILCGTYALGGPHYLSKKYADRIDNRPDEHYRRQTLTKK
jgi:rhamnose utilization protein RhaD (predicted bifunctional aldolase and dehydrogenase)